MHNRAGMQKQIRGHYGYAPYEYDNLARKYRAIDLPEDVKRTALRAEVKSAKRAKEISFHKNLGYVLFLSIAIVGMIVLLYSYIGLQSQLTVKNTHISNLNARLNELRISNDEAMSRIESSIEMEEYKRVAFQELGMREAKEGQVVNITGEGSDYMRQLADIQ